MGQQLSEEMLCDTQLTGAMSPATSRITSRSPVRGARFEYIACRDDGYASLSQAQSRDLPVSRPLRRKDDLAEWSAIGMAVY
mmetsp:Transcript_101628/g.284916  ORF Transcript_101628/g.284916 Transcript_101628/m.284916 type:complete len:82 (-) Transcript_101628:264-509(-)